MIRPATPDDLDTILAFIRELAEYEKATYAVVLDRDIFRRQVFEEKAARVLIAEDEETGQPVGFALYFFNFSTWLGRSGLYLEDLFIRPAHRGRGYGTALLRELARTAIAKDCGRMEWWVLDWNASAIGFYKSLGAQPMDEWTVFRLTGEPLRRLAEAGTRMA
jgi:GNAT superfamily N-acetyltransferase